MRVVVAALALSALSFAAGVAGDLSMAAPPPPSVILRLPPIPEGAVRAHPLPPLSAPHTASAAASRQTARNGRRARVDALAEGAKPLTIQDFVAAKREPDWAPKKYGPDSTQI